MIRFGTLGAARITPTALLQPCENEPRASVTVVAARSRERAEAFATEHNIATVVDDYQAVIDHRDVDAIYIPLPITAHKEWTIKALRAGKPVLCEKSFAANEAQAREMAAVAKETGLVLMDAFHYRYHPLFERAREIFHSGVLGKIEQVDALFHAAITDAGDIRMIYETGGGVTMDIGCYPISWVRHMIGSEPQEVSATAEIGPHDVDVYLKSEMVFPGGIRATTEGDMRAGTEFKASIIVTGEEGSMVVTNPIAPQFGHSLDVTVDGKTSNETFDRRATYCYQLDAFLDAIEKGAAFHTTPEDAVNQMRTIDRCYEAAGLKLRGH